MLKWPEGLVVNLSEGMSVGGGRGVRATQNIVSGQLVLTEMPLVSVPHDKTPDVRLVHGSEL
jgi:hypothetical protein